MTADRAPDSPTDRNVSHVRDAGSHDWGGAEVAIRYAEGNPLQAVE